MFIAEFAYNNAKMQVLATYFSNLTTATILTFFSNIRPISALSLVLPIN